MCHDNKMKMKNKKAAMSELMRLILWIVIFIILGTAVYFLLDRLMGG